MVKAVDYLLNANRGYRMDLGPRVVVIGGGFVAFDAAPTAMRVSSEAELAALEGETTQGLKESLDSARALAVALVVWFLAVVLVDLAALGVALLLPSGPASR